MANSFQKYSVKQIHFYDDYVPKLLQTGLALVSKTEDVSIIDLGCGDGRLIYALNSRSLLKSVKNVVGLDISETRIRRMKRQLPFVKGFVSDVLNVNELQPHSFDLVICSQLIEHVGNDRELVIQIENLMKPRGLAYISSVIKKWYGAYFYVRERSFRLDPFHLREYSSVEEFVHLVECNRMKTLATATCPLMFPIKDLTLRAMVTSKLVDPETGLFRNNKMFNKIRQLAIPVFGFEIVEVLAKKVS